MALDGIAIANIVQELQKKVLGGRVDKIYQPEKDEIVLAIRSLGTNYKLMLTANSSHPCLRFTEQSKNNPMQAPLFCMVLRKHLSSGKIVDICQVGFERIVQLSIESPNEMGDYSIKKLIIEIMGKHSNIILVDESDKILECIKHISHDTSSVREVLPGKQYVLPPSQDKLNPLELTQDVFLSVTQKPAGMKIQNSIYQRYSGISPIMASEICHRAGVAPDSYAEAMSEPEFERVFDAFAQVMNAVKEHDFCDEIILDEKEKPIEFSSVRMTMFDQNKKKSFESVSALLETFYGERDIVYRVGQKTTDLRKIIQQNIERCIKKKEMYQKTLREIQNREQLKVLGELITANIYSIEKGMTSFTTPNFYEETCADITIRLDPNLTPPENAQRYFKKYSKEKRTFLALQDQITQNEDELEYLEGVLESIHSCMQSYSTNQTTIQEQDIEEIRDELIEIGILKKRKQAKSKSQKKSKPMHFISSDQYDIFVGKNNHQNDELTLRFAQNNDLWFHTKEIPGSHVIIKTNGDEVPTQTLNEAANLAAFFSKGRISSHVPVDYTQKKNVKKPNGAKPGMVIYDNYKTAYVTPNEALVMDMEKRV